MGSTGLKFADSSLVGHVGIHFRIVSTPRKVPYRDHPQPFVDHRQDEDLSGYRMLESAKC